MEHMITWFEIPTDDLSRAAKFYSEIFDAQIEPTEFAGMKMAFFPADGTNVSGALIQEENIKPAANGPRIYLNGGEDLNNVLSKVESAGGKVIVEKTLISEENGYFGVFMDTEGNSIALHSK